MSTDGYVPSEGEVRLVWSEWSNYGGLTNRPDYDADRTQMRAEFDRFLARVRRDAARSGYHHGYNDRRLERDYNHAYPEETP